MKILGRVVLIGLAVVLLAAGGLYLVPLSSYLPRIEQAGAQALGEPVKIGGLRLALLPAPHATLTDIGVGKAGELRIDKLIITPKLTSLASSVKVLRRVELKGVSAPVSLLPALSPRDRAGATPIARIERIAVTGARFALPSGGMIPLDADISLGATGRAERIEVRSPDGRIRIEGLPEKDHMKVNLVATHWTLPAGAPIRFDRLTAAGELRESALTIKTITGALYGGTLAGDAELGWRKGFSLHGSASLQGVAIEPLLALFTNSAKLSGLLDTRARFSATAPDVAALADAVRADGSFVVRNGVLRNVDLARTASLVGGAHTRGGNTRFDEFSGNSRVIGKAYRLERLSVRSGLLNARGEVDIAPSRRLDGTVWVELKSGVSLLQVPLRVAGTTQDPVLYPTGAAIAGAAVGTAVLGPAGTAAGTRLGDVIENLFGGRK